MLPSPIMSKPSKSKYLTQKVLALGTTVAEQALNASVSYAWAIGGSKVSLNEAILNRIEQAKSPVGKTKPQLVSLLKGSQYWLKFSPPPGYLPLV